LFLIEIVIQTKVSS